MTEEEIKILQAENLKLKAEKEKFFSIISLWLSSPLNNLKALSDMLLGQADSMDKAGIMEFNKHLGTEINKLSGSMQNLIEWANLETGNFKINKTSFELDGLIEEAIDSIKVQALKKAIAIADFEPSGITIETDKKMLRLMVGNLLSNAVKFSRKDDTIKVEVSRSDSKTIIGVTDSGVGMGPAKLAAIFNTERKSQPGTANEQGFGLGLVTNKKVIELLEGSIQIDSTPGKGTEAKLIF